MQHGGPGVDWRYPKLNTAKPFRGALPVPSATVGRALSAIFGAGVIVVAPPLRPRDDPQNYRVCGEDGGGADAATGVGFCAGEAVGLGAVAASFLKISCSSARSLAMSFPICC